MAGGRPVQRGLNYFNLDTSPGDKIKYLKKKCQIEGYGIFVLILERIYKFEGYYCKWDEMAQVLFCDNGIELVRLKEVVNCCLDVGLFNRDVFEKYQVLTSGAIQHKYTEIIHRCKRKGVEISPKIALPYFGDLNISSEETLVNSEETLVNSEETLVSSEETTNDIKTKAKKSKSVSSEENRVFSELSRRNPLFPPKKLELIPKKPPVSSELNTQSKGKGKKEKEKKEKNKKEKSSENSEAEFPVEKKIEISISGSDTSKKIFLEKSENENGNGVAKPESLFQKMMGIYFGWMKSQTDIVPKIDGAEGKALKSIIAYFKTISHNEEEIITGWEAVLGNYERWDKFHQKQLLLRQINSNLINIINSIKNGKKGSTEAKSIAELRSEIGDIDE